MICVCFVGWDLCDLHDLFDVHGTYLCDLQFQVDFMHNIYIHSGRKGYRGVKRPHTSATCVTHIINPQVMISIFHGRYCWSCFTVDLCMIYSPHHTSVMFSCWDLCDTASAHTSVWYGSCPTSHHSSKHRTYYRWSIRWSTRLLMLCSLCYPTMYSVFIAKGPGNRKWKSVKERWWS